MEFSARGGAPRKSIFFLLGIGNRSGFYFHKNLFGKGEGDPLPIPAEEARNIPQSNLIFSSIKRARNVAFEGALIQPFVKP